MAYKVIEEGRTPAYATMGTRGTGDWLRGLWTLQPVAQTAQLNPVAGVWYNVLLETSNVMLAYINIIQSGGVIESCDVRIIIDDVPIQFVVPTAFPALGIQYRIRTTTVADTLELVVPVDLVGFGMPLYGHTVSVDFQVTTNNGAGETVTCTVQYYVLG